MKLVENGGYRPRFSPGANRVHHFSATSPLKAEGLAAHRQPGPRFQQRTNTPRDLIDPDPRFHGGSFGVLGTPPAQALRL